MGLEKSFPYSEQNLLSKVKVRGKKKSVCGGRGGVALMKERRCFKNKEISRFKTKFVSVVHIIIWANVYFLL